jgi:hypothetical protein
MPFTGSLFLHPYVVYSLVDSGVIFHENFIKDNQKLLDNHGVNPGKRGLSYGFYGFFNVYLSLSLRKQDYLKNLLKRSKTN